MDGEEEEDDALEGHTYGEGVRNEGAKARGFG
jgi:hypothetical protein